MHRKTQEFFLKRNIHLTKEYFLKTLRTGQSQRINFDRRMLKMGFGTMVGIGLAGAFANIISGGHLLGWW